MSMEIRGSSKIFRYRGMSISAAGNLSISRADCIVWGRMRNISAFRSRKVVVSFPLPEKRKFSADIKGESLCRI